VESRPGPNYLQEVVAPLLDPKVGHGHLRFYRGKKRGWFLVRANGDWHVGSKMDGGAVLAGGETCWRASNFGLGPTICR